jgi:ATP-binding cassette subfamily B protein
MNALKRATQFMRPYKAMVILGLVTTVLPVIMELVVPRLLQYVIDQGIRIQNMQNIYWGAGLMFGAAILGTVATLGQGIARAQLSQGIAYDMRYLLFGHIQSLSYADLDRLQTGQLMTRIASDVDTVRMFSSAGLALLIRALLMVTGSMVMLFVTDWELATIMLVLLAVMAVLLRSLLRRAQPLFAVVQQKLAALNTIVQENLAGVRVVKAYVRERFEIDRFHVGNVDYRDQNIRVGRLMALALPTLALLTNLGIVSIIWWGGTSVINHRLSVGELIAFNNYLMIGMAPLLLLSNILMMVSRAEASAERYFEVLDAQPRIQKVASPFQGSRTARHAVRGRVVFDHASFHYDTVAPAITPADLTETAGRVNGQTNGQHQGAGNGQMVTVGGHGRANGHSNGAGNGQTDRYGMGAEAVLDAVSFTVEPGQQVAILGATGSGKSTLINLIPRFYDVTGGAIRIDDVDVRAWEPAVLRRNIGMVLQETTLFSGTVRENIAYGHPDASLDEVIAAAKAAQAHDFISKLPDGYDSIVEAGGTNFSGGQKQRIAIARALLIDPAILVLDDSMSAVDFETEVRLQAALEELMHGRTSFIVAQRISSVLQADQILILDGGRIAARGTHQELLANSPIYQEIYYSQLGEDRPA